MAGRAGSSGLAGSTQGKGGASGAGQGTGGSVTAGSNATGGISATGGASGASTGGSAGTATGGSSGSGATGGTGMSGSAGSASGGVNAVGGSGGGGSTCTDLPPNNGEGCENAVEYGWCEMEWLGDSCQRTCGKCTGGGSGGAGGSSGGSGGSGGSGKGGSGSGTNTPPPPNINGGQQAWASRYWDCCKPACGWSANAGGTPMKSCNQQNQTLGDNDARNACESGGSAYMCWNGAPWQVGDNLSYGFAAASGPNYQCGRCFHVQFNGTGHNGNSPGVQSLQGKHMIVQVINNGGVAQDQFDILIPGGGVGLLNACTTQWGTADLGAQYGGFLAGCNGDKSCVQNKCNTVFAGKPELLEGCEWFLGWYNAADNPNFTYERIACPAEITQRSGLQDR